MLVNGPDPDGIEESRIVARIRHWTREGVMAPAGIRNPGTGRHRRYGARSVIDAAVLNVLANDEQIIVCDIPGYFQAQVLARAAYLDWSAEGGHGPHFLELVSAGRSKDGMLARTVRRHRGYPVKHDATVAVSFIVNLSLIFDRLPALSWE
jgi:hypothetical protein